MCPSGCLVGRAAMTQQSDRTEAVVHNRNPSLHGSASRQSLVWIEGPPRINDGQHVEELWIVWMGFPDELGWAVYVFVHCVVTSMD